MEHGVPLHRQHLGGEPGVRGGGQHVDQVRGGGRVSKRRAVRRLEIGVGAGRVTTHPEVAVIVHVDTGRQVARLVAARGGHLARQDLGLEVALADGARRVDEHIPDAGRELAAIQLARVVGAGRVLGAAGAAAAQIEHRVEVGALDAHRDVGDLVEIDTRDGLRAGVVARRAGAPEVVGLPGEQLPLPPLAALQGGDPAAAIEEVVLVGSYGPVEAVLGAVA